MADNTYEVTSVGNAKGNTIVVPAQYNGKAVTSIGVSAFSDCATLTSITLPTSVTAIGDNAFYYCSGLTSITLPTSLKTIGSNAFSGCALTSVIMPKGVTAIGMNAFDSGALTVYCEEASKPTNWNANWNGASTINWSSAGSTGFTFIPSKDSSSYAVSAFTGTDTEIIIPAIYQGKFVKEIGFRTFENNNTLTKITIPNSVTSICSNAFYSCSALTSIIIPNSVTSIGNSTFSFCKKLVSVTLPTSLEAIEADTFNCCYELANITLPTTLKTIGLSAFYACGKLARVTIPIGVTTIGAGAFGLCDVLIIKCECTQAGKPTGWHAEWNQSNRPVEWGYTGK